MVPSTVSSYEEDDSTTSNSESFRPLMLATMACKRLMDRKQHSEKMAQPPIDFQREINSLQQEIESLKLELVSQ
jgi:hypothetical protein